MRVFSVAGAQHYCHNFQAGAVPLNTSLDDFVQGPAGRLRAIAEGSAEFDGYRTLALRNAERDLFLAASHFRRSLDLMIQSSSHWAHVTLYYGAMFAARSLLGMFGCRVFANNIMEVDRSQPGSQRLVKRSTQGGSNIYALTRRGSHERFWEAFYNAARSIRRLTNAPSAAALTPISNDAGWLTKQRNRANYTAEESVGIAHAFGATFDINNIPHSLPGVINTQFRVCQGLLSVALDFTDQFGLSTDALDVYGNQNTFREKVIHFVYDIPVPKFADLPDAHRLFGLQRRPPLTL